MSNVKLFLCSTIECRTSNCFDVPYLNVESQNDTNIKRQTVLTLELTRSNVKLFLCLTIECRTSNCFDVQHSNAIFETASKG